MCELLGMSANVPTDICFSFTGLMQRGGRTGFHRDGWGIAFYEGGGCRTFHDTHPSAESEIAQLIRRSSIKSYIVVSHIRKANRGRVCLANTHPFVRELWGRYWTFAHNGQLKGIKKHALEFYRPVGTTDSEHAFCWLLDQIRKSFPDPPRQPSQLWRLVQSICEELNTLGVFNMLLSDSRYLYTFRSTHLSWKTRRSPFGPARLSDVDFTVDFSAETTPNDIVTVVATKPLTDNEQWDQCPLNQLEVLHDGLPVFCCDHQEPRVDSIV